MEKTWETILKESLPTDLQLVCYEETDSTQTRAKAAFLSDGAKERLHIARSQTAGRGRTGKSFYSPKDDGLYMTLTLSIPGKKTQDCIYLTTLAACCVRRAIWNSVHIATEIKWVNDLYLSEKKVCGILVEALPKDGWFLVGIGINLTTDSFPEELAKKAGALFRCAGETLKEQPGGACAGDAFQKQSSRTCVGDAFQQQSGGATVSDILQGSSDGATVDDVSTDVCAAATSSDALRALLASNIVSEFRELAPLGMTEELFQEYKGHSLLIGREITFEQDGKILRGTAKGLTKDCGLLVEVDGAMCELTSGMILDFSAHPKNDTRD